MYEQYDSKEEGKYDPKTSDDSNKREEADNSSMDRQIQKNFLDRFKTWEQLQRPWSGKW